MTAEDEATAVHELRRRRMKVARFEAGLDTIDKLALRIAELGYTKDGGYSGWSADTLGAMERGRYNDGRRRTIQPDEINVLAEACGLPTAFFHADFNALEEPSMRDELNGLKAAVAQLGADVARQAKAMQEHRDMDHRTGSSGDGDQ